MKGSGCKGTGMQFLTSRSTSAWEEQSLALLKTLDLQIQADEYAEILKQSVAIAKRVQQELYGTAKVANLPSMKGYK